MAHQEIDGGSIRYGKGGGGGDGKGAVKTGGFEVRRHMAWPMGMGSAHDSLFVGLGRLGHCSRQLP